MTYTLDAPGTTHTKISISTLGLHDTADVMFISACPKQTARTFVLCPFISSKESATTKICTWLDLSAAKYRHVQLSLQLQARCRKFGGKLHMSLMKCLQQGFNSCYAWGFLLAVPFNCGGTLSLTIKPLLMQEKVGIVPPSAAALSAATVPSSPSASAPSISPELIHPPEMPGTEPAMGSSKFPASSAGPELTPPAMQPSPHPEPWPRLHHPDSLQPPKKHLQP